MVGLDTDSHKKLSWKRLPKRFRITIIRLLSFSAAIVFFRLFIHVDKENGVSHFNYWVSTYSLLEALVGVIIVYVVIVLIISLVLSPYFIATFRNNNKTKNIFWLNISVCGSLLIGGILWIFSGISFLLLLVPAVIWGSTLICSFTNSNNIKGIPNRIIGNIRLSWRKAPKKFRTSIVGLLSFSSFMVYFFFFIVKEDGVYRFKSWATTYGWWETLGVTIIFYIGVPVFLSFVFFPYLIATFRNHNKTKRIFWLCILAYLGSIPIVILVWDYSNSLFLSWLFPVVIWGGTLIWSFRNKNTKDKSSRVN